MLCPKEKCGHYLKATKYPRKCYNEPQCWRGKLESLFTVFAKKSKVISTLVILAFTLASILSPAPVRASSWWDTDWAYRIVLTFDNSASAENLIDFPVLVKLTSSNFDFSKAQSDGDDLRFIDANDSTVLDYERVSYSAVTETAEIWVEVQIDAGSTTDFIYLYFGNATCADGQNASGTWNSNYVLVDHMADNPDTSHTKDSTSNDNDGTKKGANEPIEADGIVGKAQSFAGDDDYNNYGADASLQLATQITVETLIKVTQDSERRNIAAKQKESVGERSWSIEKYSNNRLRFDISPDGNTISSIYSDEAALNDTDYYLVCTYDGTTQYMHLNKVLQANSATPAALNAGTQDVIAGKYGFYALRFWNNLLDELRISDIARSDDWLEATYLTETDAFITYGAEGGLDMTPTNLTLTDMGAISVGASWGGGPSATYTMIRASRTSYPATPAEGEFVYYGANTTLTTSGYSLDISKYYFVAIGYASDNVTYSTTFAKATIGGEFMEELAAMVGTISDSIGGELSTNIGLISSSLTSTATEFMGFLVMVVVMLGLAALAFWRNNRALFIISGFAFIIYGFTFWSTSQAFSILMVLTGMVFVGRGIMKKGETI